jgi:hypothetical protein
MKQEHVSYCFPVRIELLFERNASCKSKFSKWSIAHVVPCRPCQQSWRITCIPPKNHLCLAYCVTVRIEVVLNEILPAIHSFQSGVRLLYLKIGLFSWVEGIFESQRGKETMAEWVKSCVLFPSDNWGSFRMVYLCKLGASGGERVCLLQIVLFSRVEGTHISLERTKSVVKEGPSSTLFTCENWVSFWREYFLQIIVFKVEICSVSLERHIQLSWRYTFISPKKNIYVRSCSI